MQILKIIVVFPRPGNVLYNSKNPLSILFLTAFINSICESNGFNFISGIVISYFVSNINFGLLFAISTNLTLNTLDSSLILYSKSFINCSGNDISITVHITLKKSDFVLLFFLRLYNIFLLANNISSLSLTKSPSKLDDV